MRPALLFSAGLILLLGCQGAPKRRPPININPNMDHQPKYKAQGVGEFFADEAAMRYPVPGTVARGSLREDDVYFRGRVPGTDRFVVKGPVAPDRAGLERGRQRFNIYCSACHSRAGDGKGIVGSKGFVPPPADLTSDLVRNYPDGHIFNVISNGVRSMPSYAVQIPVADRWLIINYVRALQRSRRATLADVPAEMRIGMNVAPAAGARR